MRIFVCLAFLIFVLQNSNAVCPPAGDSREARIQALNVSKNRLDPPTKIDNSITLAKILAPGNDAKRFKPTDGATITGYVVEVKRGGLESCNCHSKVNRDWHIEFGATPNAKPTQCVIVEVTPHLPIIPNPKSLVGRKIQVTGWMFFDEEHKQNARNTNPKGTDLWRATCWEIHPVTKIDILNRSAWIRPPFPPKTYAPDSWEKEMRDGEIETGEYLSLVAGHRDLMQMRILTRRGLRGSALFGRL